MLSITNPQIEKYLFDLAKKYDEKILNQMEVYGRENRFPIIDRLVGAFIHMITSISGAKTVFELGSGYGYSAYWFLKAMGPKGKIVCTDGDEENAQKAKEYLSQAGLWKQVDFKVGEAIGCLKESSASYDIVYNDIDKREYPQAWIEAKKHIRPGGLYIVDNTLWYGRVAENQVTDDIVPGWTEAIKKHNEMIYSDSHFDVTLVPLRDGVIVARRKN